MRCFLGLGCQPPAGDDQHGRVGPEVGAGGGDGDSEVYLYVVSYDGREQGQDPEAIGPPRTLAFLTTECHGHDKDKDISRHTQHHAGR